MSGGVDSSVAAALMAEEYGKENVFGVTMRLFCYAGQEFYPKSCCSIEAINDAKAVCQKLGIKHYIIDFEKEFKEEVIDDFISEYLYGRTPNPCIRCNQVIKFEYLLDKARGLGADWVATGHYARIQKLDRDGKEIFMLLKGLDEAKDQSYFLYRLIQKQLAHILFPLGELSKSKVREIAGQLGLKTAERAESQEICFIKTTYRDFIMEQIEKGEGPKVKEGNIVDRDGNILGKHIGLPFYTIGQRRGIGIAAREPLYIIEIDVKNNCLIVGPEEKLYKKEFKVRNISWVSGELPAKEFKADVAIRYNMEPQPAKMTVQNKVVEVIFNELQRAITPGQSAVFYQGEEVLGGGIIELS
ncbi:MAG: tRNA 2-thiouridine(34) synthase MnmA [Patescibacteria group bacterium]|nr:tRNA 2-thiouridine(34) synthase MnmA [Patescibacteria group bacterium]